MTAETSLRIRFATAGDCATILGFIRELASYERLAHEVVADEEKLRATLFPGSLALSPVLPSSPARPAAEVVLAERGDDAVGFALFFTSYSTFLAKPGLYLEDLFVRPSERSAGVGGALMAALARVAVERDYGRFEWSVLDWNEPALAFYRRLGATPMSEWTVQRLVGAPLAELASRGQPVR